MNRHFIQRLNQIGQTSIEYLLVMVVAISIGMAMKKKMEEFVLTNPNSFLNRQLQGLSSSFSTDTDGRYRVFRLHKAN